MQQNFFNFVPNPYFQTRGKLYIKHFHSLVWKFPNMNDALKKGIRNLTQQTSYFFVKFKKNSKKFKWNPKEGWEGVKTPEQGFKILIKLKYFVWSADKHFLEEQQRFFCVFFNWLLKYLKWYAHYGPINYSIWRRLESVI